MIDSIFLFILCGCQYIIFCVPFLRFTFPLRVFSLPQPFPPFLPAFLTSSTQGLLSSIPSIISLSILFPPACFLFHLLLVSESLPFFLIFFSLISLSFLVYVFVIASFQFFFSLLLPSLVQQFFLSFFRSFPFPHSFLPSLFSSFIPSFISLSLYFLLRSPSFLSFRFCSFLPFTCFLYILFLPYSPLRVSFLPSVRFP